jgi:hypothetical protein
MRVMLSLRSISRETDVLQGQQLDGTRKTLHGLKAIQEDACWGMVGAGLRPKGKP